ncbi:SMP-30/gluconolactonase/LRE family protein, partial [Caballeronia sp. LZ008]|nr:SMP-30/gluconolactonase/LRE family protein [Caballeronia sp. LZ008]
MESDIRILADGLMFPEGPVAMADGSVVLVEIERETISRVSVDGSVSVDAETVGWPNSLAVGPDG